MTDEECQSFASSISSVDDQLMVSPSSPPRVSRARQPFPPATECFSRKVFVGGLPPDIDEGQLQSCVRGAVKIGIGANELHHLRIVKGPFV
jgi:hypothetical protein